MNEDIRIYGEASPRAHYVPALGHAGLVFTSGQLPFLADGSDGSERPFEDQVRQVLDNLDRVLVAAGTNRTRLLHLTAFIVGIDNWGAFNVGCADYFGDWRPTRTVVPCPASISAIC